MHLVTIRTSILAFAMMAMVATTARADAYDIGVIPQTVSNPPSASDCPAGSSLIYVHMDDEDYNNENNRYGWIGATASNQYNTRFYFCKVDGRQFKPLSTTDSTSNHYAVLRLGDYCPPGSGKYWRLWDNENSNNKNAIWTSSGNSSDFGPNTIDFMGAEDTQLHFCVFRYGPATMSQFPNLGIQYGVFAASGFSKAVQSGWVYTDDDDGNNTNNNTGADNSFDLQAGERIIHPTSTDGRNTTVYMARVTPETRPVARCTVSPTSGTGSVYAVFENNGSYARGGRVISNYSWSFSDGATASGPGPHGRSFSAGTHWGRLTVTDNYGEKGMATCYVTVYSESCLSASRDPDAMRLPGCP